MPQIMKTEFGKPALEHTLVKADLVAEGTVEEIPVSECYTHTTLVVWHEKVNALFAPKTY